MSNRKVIFFDIDETIFRAKYGVCASTKIAIRELIANGHIPVINTGRARCMIFPSLINLGFKDILSGAGSLVEHENEVLYKHDLPLSEIDEMVDSFYEFGFYPIPEGHEKLYYDPSITDEKYHYLFDKLYYEVKDSMFPIEKGNTHAMKACGLITKDSDILGLKKKYSDKYDICDHHGKLLELIPKGLSKQSAMKVLLKRLNIGREDTYAFGDSDNDIPMIEYAGVGVAMGNACEVCKNASDYVTNDLADDGVYKALMHFGLI